MAVCKFVSDAGSVPVTFGADVACGDVVAIGDQGLFGWVNQAYKSGETGTVFTGGICDLANTASTAHDAGDNVFWDATNKKALAAQTAADEPVIGVCVKAAVSGDSTVRVWFGKSVPIPAASGGGG